MTDDTKEASRSSLAAQKQADEEEINREIFKTFLFRTLFVPKLTPIPQKSIFSQNRTYCFSKPNTEKDVYFFEKMCFWL